MQACSHVFVFFSSFLRCSYFAVKVFYLVEEDGEFVVEVFSSNACEFFAFSQEVRPASLQGCVGEVVVCSPAVAMYNSSILFSQYFFENVVSSTVSYDYEFLGWGTEDPHPPFLSKNAEARFVDVQPQGFMDVQFEGFIFCLPCQCCACDYRLHTCGRKLDCKACVEKSCCLSHDSTNDES